MPRIEESEAQAFWEQVVDAAIRVLLCERCEELQQEHLAKWEGQYGEALPDMGYSQPGWVGPDYQPGHGLVFVLQNPAVGGIADIRNETAFQESLNRLLEQPDIDNYHAYVAIVMQQMYGWDKWRQFISPIIEGWLAPEQVAWINAVKYRTPKNKRPSSRAIHHGTDGEMAHLRRELEILRPKVVVTIGRVAEDAVKRIMDKTTLTFHHEHIAMCGAGSSQDDARAIGNRIRLLIL